VSSPLCNLVLDIRRILSDDQFFLSQLDHSFERSYAHLTSAMQGFLRGWNRDCGKKVVMDKNCAWLHAIELLLQIEPDAKLLVCLRELGQIYGSIEVAASTHNPRGFHRPSGRFRPLRTRRHAVRQRQNDRRAVDFTACQVISIFRRTIHLERMNTQGRLQCCRPGARGGMPRCGPWIEVKAQNLTRRRTA
jgi:hypothetical protein